MGGGGSKEDERPAPKRDIRDQRRNAVHDIPPSRHIPPSRAPDRYQEQEEDDSSRRFHHRDDEDDRRRGRASSAAAPASPPPEPGRPGDNVKCTRKCDLDRPKRALSPFNCFVRSVKTGQGDESAKSVGRNCDMKTIADRWHSMTDAQKKPYIRLSGADKQRYSNDKKLYESIKRQIIRRPKNSYIIFMRKFRRENRRNYPDPREMTREGARAWKCLRPEEKHPYNSESLRDSKRYADERKKYCNRVVLPRRNDTRLAAAAQDADDEREEEEEDEEEKEKEEGCDDEEDMDTTTDLND